MAFPLIYTLTMTNYNPAMTWELNCSNWFVSEQWHAPAHYFMIYSQLTHISTTIQIEISRKTLRPFRRFITFIIINNSKQKIEFRSHTYAASTLKLTSFQSLITNKYQHFEFSTVPHSNYLHIQICILSSKYITGVDLCVAKLSVTATTKKKQIMYSIFDVKELSCRG